jgi:C-terminal processing protease CtpA/Prc
VLLQITIARWTSYNGEWYQGSGVAPLMEAADNPATETDELLEAAIQYLSEH